LTSIVIVFVVSLRSKVSVPDLAMSSRRLSSQFRAGEELVW
jgi:hypothetical protein